MFVVVVVDLFSVRSSFHRRSIWLNWSREADWKKTTNARNSFGVCRVAFAKESDFGLVLAGLVRKMLSAIDGNHLLLLYPKFWTPWKRTTPRKLKCTRIYCTQNKFVLNIFFFWIFGVLFFVFVCEPDRYWDRKRENEKNSVGETEHKWGPEDTQPKEAQFNVAQPNYRTKEKLKNNYNDFHVKKNHFFHGRNRKKKKTL